jgi:hypothetical protein
MEYQKLVNAIIVQAADDYREAYKILKNDYTDTKARKTFMDCELFFVSKWFEQLTNLDGYDLLQRLKAEFISN